MCRVGGLIQNAHLNFTENWQRSNVFIMTKVDHMPISWPLQFPLNASSHERDSLCFWKLAVFDNDLPHSPIEKDLNSKKCSVGETNTKWKFGSKYTTKPNFEIFWREKLKKIDFEVGGMKLAHSSNNLYLLIHWIQRWRCSVLILFEVCI